MKKIITLLISLCLASPVFGQTKVVRLLCDGQETTSRGIHSEKNETKTRTFSVEFVVDKNKITFKKSTLPLKGIIGRLREKDGLLETISESEYSILMSYAFPPPIKGGGDSSFVINRYTGKAKSTEVFAFANDVEADVFTVEGDYSCSESLTRKF